MSAWRATGRLNAGLERLFGLRLTHASYHGHRDCADILRSGCRVSVIADVGANVGQSAERFREAFPHAALHCFEPVASTFAELTRRVGSWPGVTCHRLALGREEGEASMFLTGASGTSSLRDPGVSTGVERVHVRRLDLFADEHGIPRVDLLKVDAEGQDLEVLQGARALLAEGRVAFVLVEASFVAGDPRLVPFDDIKSFLAPLGFSVFGIYEQHLEWTGEQRLRLANVCFSNEAAFIRA